MIRPLIFRNTIVFTLVLLPFLLLAQIPTQPGQFIDRPGGSDYLHTDIWFQDFAQQQDGYWLFEPLAPKPDSAEVIVFLHGYGALNPMIYGKWIRHLVLQGNIVIYPRYQKDLLKPRTTKFDRNAARAIRSALKRLNTPGHVKPKTENLALIGHSYGGVIATNLSMQFEKWNIPKPRATMTCSAGTSLLKGGRLTDYAPLPAELKLLMVVSEKDWITGDNFSRRVLQQAVHTPMRNLLIQRKDKHGVPDITAHHNEPYAIDLQFDTGERNATINRAYRVSTFNAIDFNGYWKLFDALLDCQRAGNNCQWAFGDTDQQRSLGTWSDGVAIRPLDVILPKDWPSAPGKGDAALRSESSTPKK